LTLAGHTHGGQIRIPLLWPTFVPSRYGARFAYGHIVESGRHMIVSGGLGTSTLPVRLGMPPEIGHIDIDGGPAAGTLAARRSTPVNPRLPEIEVRASALACRQRHPRVVRRIALPRGQHHHRAAELDPAVEVDHVLIGEPDAAGGNRLADIFRLVGAVDA